MINPIVCRNNNLLINKYKSLEELNISVANNLYESILESKLNFSLAICGGKTPIGIFSLLSQHFLKKKSLGKKLKSIGLMNGMFHKLVCKVTLEMLTAYYLIKHRY